MQVLVAGEYEQELTLGTGDLVVEYASWSEGDWNGDGVFDTDDFVIALEDGGYEKGPREDAAAVPEPHSLLLLVFSPMWLRAGKGPYRGRRFCWLTDVLV